VKKQNSHIPSRFRATIFLIHCCNPLSPMLFGNAAGDWKVVRERIVYDNGSVL
jgi:hypothetical protein